MSRPSITDWIQAIAVVLGVGFAVYELRLADALSDRQKVRQVADMLAGSADASVIQSAASLLRFSEAGSEERFSRFDVLAELTPFHENLRLWAFCYDNELCDRELTRSFICLRLIAYENGIETIFPRFGLDGHVDERPLRTTELWSDCGGGA